MSLDEAFADVLTVAKTARAPTAAWRTLCIRQRRRLGVKASDALAELELDDDVARVRAIVRDLAMKSDHDTLVFSLYDAIDDGTAAAGFYVAPMKSGGRAADDFMHDPWARDHTYLRASVLDGVSHIAARCDLRTRWLVESVMAFAAAALVARFAAPSCRIVVAFDEPKKGIPAFAELTVQKKAEETRSASAHP